MWTSFPFLDRIFVLKGHILYTDHVYNGNILNTRLFCLFSRVEHAIWWEEKMEGRSSINQRSTTIPLMNLSKMRSISLKESSSLSSCVVIIFLFVVVVVRTHQWERERGTISFALSFTREKMSTNDRRNHYRLEEGRGVLRREEGEGEEGRVSGGKEYYLRGHWCTPFIYLTLTDTHFTTFRYTFLEEFPNLSFMNESSILLLIMNTMKREYPSIRMNGHPYWSQCPSLLIFLHLYMISSLLHCLLNGKTINEWDLFDIGWLSLD